MLKGALWYVAVADGAAPDASAVLDIEVRRKAIGGGVGQRGHVVLAVEARDNDAPLHHPSCDFNDAAMSDGVACGFEGNLQHEVC